MHTQNIAIRFTFAIALGVTALGCSSGSSDPKNGVLICGTGTKPCPDGYQCSQKTNTCWKNGTLPSEDGGTTDADAQLPGDAGFVPELGGHDTILANDLSTADGAPSDAPRDVTLGDVSPDEPGADVPLPDASTDVPPRDSNAPDLPLSPGDTAPSCPSGKVVCGSQCIDPAPAGCCAASDCTGTCMTCGADHTCVAAKNQDDPNKVCAGTCDASGVCKKKKGQGCQSTATDCVGGTTCSPDGVCCDSACTGTCEACDLAANPGTCSTLSAGSAPHKGHTACVATDTACAGTCNGTSASCTYPTTACGTATCTGLVYQPKGACNAGACTMPTTQSCANLCSATTGGCTGVCTPDKLQCSASNVPQKCSADGAWQDQTPCGNGFTCSAGACVCRTGATDCGTACADLSSDAKNCGTCGHDCLGGTCSSGICQPVMLATVTETRPSGYLYADGGKVYAVTMEWAALDTSRLWVLDATIPGTATKVLPEFSSYIRCVMNGTALWDNGTDTNGNQVFSYCTPSNCSATTKSFTIPGTGASGETLQVWPTCDLANSEVVWAMQATSGTDSTISVWRSSITGANIRTVTSFLLNNGADSSTGPQLAAGRSDRLFFLRTTGTAIQLVSVPTGTQNATPTVIASGNTGGPLDFGYGIVQFYADDSLLVWSTDKGTYQAPLPSGIGSNSPATFTQGLISSGIMDNKHFYGMFSLLSSMAWCPVSNCGSPAVLTTSIPSSLTIQAVTQDSAAIYWTVSSTDGSSFTVWKVAKQPF